MLPALFLDRDGVIIENRPGYVLAWQDVKFLPGVLESLAQVADIPARIVLITNQAAIGKGLITRAQADEINRRLLGVITRMGGRVDGLYLCPHRPEDNCQCRKPRPGLILQAARELEINLQTSLLVGDNLTDLQAGQAAGVGRLALVRTGLGETFIPQLKAARFAQVALYDSLVDVLREWKPG